MVKSHGKAKRKASDFYSSQIVFKSPLIKMANSLFSLPGLCMDFGPRLQSDNKNGI